MVEQSLLEYVKNGLRDGFSRLEIEKVLRKVGWTETDIAAAFGAVQSLGAPSVRMSHPTPPAAQPVKDAKSIDSILRERGAAAIEDNFFARHQKAMIVGLIILVALPVLTYGGFLAYQKFVKKTATDSVPTSSTERPEDNETNIAAAKSRDETRLQDIGAIQTALDTFNKTNSRYPKNLKDLKEYEQAAPADPKSKEPYLYVAYGDPAIHYSLSFLLETRVGTLKAGLQVVTSEQPLPVELIKKQDQVVRGAQNTAITKNLLITALDKIPFYPGEEVRVEIDQSQVAGLKSVFLTTDSMELVDTTAPFTFSFTAPKTPGQYHVQVFGFDAGGAGWLERTILTVTPK